MEGDKAAQRRRSRKLDTDDQAAQLFVAFFKTRAIVYVWSTTERLGTTGQDAASPFFMSVKTVVRSGYTGTGSWITETRNVYDDYKKLSAMGSRLTSMA
jgi:hypothetical protein